MTDIEVEEMKRLGMDISAKASANHGQYLLPRRYHLPKPGEPRSDVDKKYDACGWLVMEGHARWIDAGSSMSPGIQLTGLFS